MELKIVSSKRNTFILLSANGLLVFIYNVLNVQKEFVVFK